MQIPYAAPSNVFNDQQIENRVADHVERESGGDLHIGPSSMDLHVYPQQIEIQGGNNNPNIDPIRFNVTNEEEHPQDFIITDRDPLRIHPGEFCLARTDEHFDLPAGVMALMHGRSSIGRLGLFVENAGLVDRGFEGTLTLELFNPTDNVIEVPAHTRLAQLLFIEQGGRKETAYDGKYQGQKRATLSRAYEDE